VWKAVERAFALFPKGHKLLLYLQRPEHAKRQAVRQPVQPGGAHVTGIAQELANPAQAWIAFQWTGLNSLVNSVNNPRYA
jgi:hypothetical protein